MIPQINGKCKRFFAFFEKIFTGFFCPQDVVFSGFLRHKMRKMQKPPPPSGGGGQKAILISAGTS
ncbi:MAG: hypothetical protein E7541_04010 [Ruminococcaceae bacterium]|nr:hypothetical protein [Oscillospiraceae bacterium]